MQLHHDGEREISLRERKNAHRKERIFNIATNMQYEMTKLFAKNQNDNALGPRMMMEQVLAHE